MFKILKSKDKSGQIPFKLKFCTAQKKTKRGGDILEWDDMIFVWPKSKVHKNNPNLFMNGAFNIQPLGGGRITTVHLILVREINGHIVS